MAANYQALAAQWATLTGTTAEKLAAVNAMTVADGHVDVDISSIVGTLMLSGAYLPLVAFSQTAANSVAVHDQALIAAKMLVACITIPNAPSFGMSDPTKYATIKGLLDAILAQETALAGSTGITQAVHDQLLALADRVKPWWAANGYTSAFNDNDIAIAGLV